MKTTDEPVIVENTLDYPREKVWQALTVHSQMIQWYFEVLEAFEPVVGFETQFVISVEDRVFTHCWHVSAVEPNSKITYSWHYKEYPGKANVTFELSEADKGTDVRVVVDVLEDFDDEIPEFRRDSCVAGWNYFMVEQLPDFLAG